MSETPTTSNRYPEGRYPTRSAASRGKRWGFTAAGVIAGIILGIVLIGRLGTDISSEVVGFDVVDDTTLDVRFTVTREDPTQEAVCIVRARSRDGSESGRREVLIPASDAAVVNVMTTVRTSERPGMGDTYGCSFNVPEYLRAP